MTQGSVESGPGLLLYYITHREMVTITYINVDHLYHCHHVLVKRMLLRISIKHKLIEHKNVRHMINEHVKTFAHEPHQGQLSVNSASYTRYLMVGL